MGNKGEISASIDETIKEKTKSPFYGSFILSWIIINWKLLYILIFISSDKIFEKANLLKNEYITNLLPPIKSWEHWLNFAIYPFLLSIFIFWVLPFITREFYKKSIRNSIRLEKIRLDETTEKTEQVTKLVEKETALIAQEVEQSKQKKRAKAEDPEILWEREFKDFQKNVVYSRLGEIVNVLYDNGGRTIKYINNTRIRQVNANTLAVLDTKGLIKIIEEDIDEPEKIELTEKGRFFLDRYLSEKDKDYDL